MTGILDFTIPHVLRNESEYRTAVSEIDALLDADVAEGSVEWERLRFLSVLVEAYEREVFPPDEILAGSTPQSAVEFMMEQRGWTRADLEPLLGGKSRVSEFLSGRRALSKAQILALREELGIPADLLLGTHSIRVD